jgi:hypothetical protein
VIGKDKKVNSKWVGKCCKKNDRDYDDEDDYGDVDVDG